MIIFLTIYTVILGGFTLRALLGQAMLEKRVDKHKAILERHDSALGFVQNAVADRLLKLDAAPSDEPEPVPRGEIREVVRSYAPPFKLPGWGEVRDAAHREVTGWSWRLGARSEAVEKADAWMRKLDRVARASRLHLDGPTDETRAELDTALREAGLEMSRQVEV